MTDRPATDMEHPVRNLATPATKAVTVIHQPNGCQCAIDPHCIAASPAALDVERLIRAFYNTPRKPRLAETEAEHIARAVAEYARLTEQEDQHG